MILTGLFLTLTTIFNAMTITNNELENMRVECVTVSYCSRTSTGATEENSRYSSLKIAGLLDVNLIRNIAIIIPHYCEVQLSYFSDRGNNNNSNNNNNNNTDMEVHTVTSS